MGIEPTQHFPENTTNPVTSGAKSDALAARTPAIDRDLATIIDTWATLPNAIKAAILTLVRAAGGNHA
jgi:hypothetical protein